MNQGPAPLSGVLFDLDGTLLDSAPDLYLALCRLCDERKLPRPAYETVRAVVSRGARAVLRAGMPQAEATLIEQLMPRFLVLYADIMGNDSQPFPGIPDLLVTLERSGVPWGIVTNKAGFLALPLLERLGLAARAAAIVCGDTLEQRKPDPAPVRLACTRAGMDPASAVYVGDDLRDVQAGRSAGLSTVAVSWGYLDGGDPHAWGADIVVDQVPALAAWLGVGNQA